MLHYLTLWIQDSPVRVFTEVMAWEGSIVIRIQDSLIPGWSPLVKSRRSLHQQSPRNIRCTAGWAQEGGRQAQRLLSRAEKDIRSPRDNQNNSEFQLHVPGLSHTLSNL